jgi:hypothetical protein
VSPRVCTATRRHVLLPLAIASVIGCRDARTATLDGRDADETRALAASNGEAERHGDTLRIRGTGKVSAVLADDTTEGGEYRLLRYDGRIPGTLFHGVRVGYHEGRSYLLVHERTAKQVRADARPVPSPTGRWLASASFDLEAQFDPNALTVLAPDADSVVTVFRVEATQWGPDSIAWRGDDTLVVVQRWVTDSGPGHYERREALVARHAEGWTLQPPDTSSAGEGP